MAKMTIGHRPVLASAALLLSIFTQPATFVIGTGAAQAAEDCSHFDMVSYGGDAGIPHRKFLADPFEQQWKTNVDLTPSSAADNLLVQLKAATGRPPYDTVPLDTGPQITFAAAGVVEKTPSVKDAPNLADVYKEYLPDTQGYGIPATYSIIGIAYNTQLVKDPPKSWADLWKPEYKGMLGLPTPESSLGSGFVWMAGKLNGGSDTNIDPAFKKLAGLKGNLVAIGANPGAVGNLLESGQVAIAPLWNNNTAILASKGVPLKWIMPTEGAIVVQSTMNIVKGAPCTAELDDYLNRALSVDYQTKAAAAPYFFGPTNSKVVVPDEAKPFMPSTPAEVAKLIHIDWATWDNSQAQIMDRFNKEVSTLVGQ